MPINPYYRMQNMFGPQMGNNPFGIDPNSINFNPPVVPSPQQEVVPQDMNPMTRMKDLYNPEHMATDKMWEMINSMPTRENYKPSVMRRVMAGIIGGFNKSPELAEGYLDKPYNTAMSDWKMRFDPLNTVASREQATNTQNRQFATEVLRDEDRNRQLDINQQKANTAEARAKAYIDFQKFKEKNPDWEIIKVRGGNYQFYNPKTLETKDSGIKDGTLSQLEEINARVKGQEDVARIPRTTITQGSSTTTSVTPPGTDPAKDKIDQFNRAQELANNPGSRNAKGESIIHLNDDGTNTFTIDIPGEGASNDEWTRYKDAYRHIYRRQPLFDQTPGGESNAGKPVGEQPTGTTRTTTTNRNNTSVSSKGAIGRVGGPPPTNITQGARVTIYKDGRAVGTIPDTPAQRASAIKQGYVVK